MQPALQRQCQRAVAYIGGMDALAAVREHDAASAGLRADCSARWHDSTRLRGSSRSIRRSLACLTASTEVIRTGGWRWTSGGEVQERSWWLAATTCGRQARMSYRGCDVKPGQWYLCAVCVRCQEPIPLVQVARTAVRSHEESVIPGVSCPRCGTTGNYALRHAIRLQAAGLASRRRTP